MNSLNEFDIIERYFKNQKISRPDVLLGMGDDAALLNSPPNCSLVSSIDTLVEGIHFSAQTSAFDLGYKTLAVNLSDLAAMGAEPAWMMLALTLPEINTVWLEEFSKGLFQLANQFNVQLIGGDITRGPLTITLQIQGFVPPDEALRRDGAKVGDKIYISGTLGDAGLGLRINNYSHLASPDKSFALARLNKPTPRIELGVALRKFASSAIDISDGLLADLNHILKASHAGATIDAKQLPFSSALKNLPLIAAQELAMTAGDDYELCFTVSPQKENELISKLNQLEISYCSIGAIEAKSGLRISGFLGKLSHFGFQHF